MENDKQTAGPSHSNNNQNDTDDDIEVVCELPPFENRPDPKLVVPMKIPYRKKISRAPAQNTEIENHRNLLGKQLAEMKEESVEKLINELDLEKERCDQLTDEVQEFRKQSEERHSDMLKLQQKLERQQSFLVAGIQDSLIQMFRVEQANKEIIRQANEIEKLAKRLKEQEVSLKEQIQENAELRQKLSNAEKYIDEQKDVIELAFENIDDFHKNAQTKLAEKEAELNKVKSENQDLVLALQKETELVAKHKGNTNNLRIVKWHQNRKLVRCLQKLRRVKNEVNKKQAIMSQANDELKLLMEGDSQVAGSSSASSSSSRLAVLCKEIASNRNTSEETEGGQVTALSQTIRTLETIIASSRVRLERSASQRILRRARRKPRARKPAGAAEKDVYFREPPNRKYHQMDTLKRGQFVCKCGEEFNNRQMLNEHIQSFGQIYRENFTEAEDSSA